MIAEVQREFDIGPELLDRIEFFDKPNRRNLGPHCGGHQKYQYPSSRADSRRSPRRGMPRGYLNARGFSPPLFFFPASDMDPYYFRHLAKETGARPAELRGLSACSRGRAKAAHRGRDGDPGGACDSSQTAAGTLFPDRPLFRWRRCGWRPCANCGRKAPKFRGSSWWILLLLAIPRFWQAELVIWSRGSKPDARPCGAGCCFPLKDIAAHLRRLTFLALRRVTARRHQTKIARGETPVAMDGLHSQFLLNRDAVNGYNVPEIEIPVVHFLASRSQGRFPGAVRSTFRLEGLCSRRSGGAVGAGGP